MSEENGARRAAISAFRERYDTVPSCIARAPGRVNLIGEHTDYNDGFVMPMAIDRAAWIAFRKRADRTVALYSIDFQDYRQFEIDDRSCGSDGWMKYVHAMARVLDQDYRLAGFEGIVVGEVPIGAGLSSSASIELAAARAFAATSAFAWNATEMARAAQRAENVWVGVNCGIMDQLISAAGERGHALLIDCRTLEGKRAPLPSNVAVVVLDTGTRRGLVDSAYNERRMHCEAAAAFLGVPALRDVTSASFAAKSSGMSAVMRKRARHVITENERTLRAAEALLNEDIATVGELMDASHVSLRDDFEVSSRELDGIVEIARRQAGCIGARMTGAGFGGCAVALVESALAEAFVTAVSNEYSRSFNVQPVLYTCTAAQGASIELRDSGHQPSAHALAL